MRLNPGASVSRPVSCLLQLLYTLTVLPARVGGGFGQTGKFFYFSESTTSIAGFCRYFHDLAFLPLRSQLTLSSFCELAFRERAFENDPVNHRLSVDHFTALSIAAHSCLSSLERAHLLITMGLILSQIRDSKFVSLEFCGDRLCQRGALPPGWASRRPPDRSFRCRAGQARPPASAKGSLLG